MIILSANLDMNLIILVNLILYIIIVEYNLCFNILIDFLCTLYYNMVIECRKIKEVCYYVSSSQQSFN